MNLVCCICTDQLNATADVFSTPCGHLFHNDCLNQWLARSKSCPQCRFSFAARSIHKVYFNIGNTSETSFSDFSTLQQTNDDLKLQVNQREGKIKTLETEVSQFVNLRAKLNDKYHAAQEKIRASQFLVDTLREQLRLLERDKERLKGVEDQLNKANAKLTTVKLVQDVLDSTSKDAEDIVSREKNAKTLAILVATLKRELVQSESRRKELSCYLENVQDACKKKDENIRTLRTQTELMKKNNESLKAEIDQLKIIPTIENNSNESNKQPDVPVETRKRFSIIKRYSANSAIDGSPPVHEKVRRIEESTSPYLHIKSSSVGLAPLLLKGPNQVTQASIKSKYANIEIFRKPRVTDSSSIPRLSSGNVLSGLGTPDRRNTNAQFNGLPKFKN